MINIQKCVAFNNNCGGMLKRSAQIEKETHQGESVCSGKFSNTLISKGLAEAPVTTDDLNKLLKAL